MGLIRATTGWENLARAQAKVYLFHSPNAQQPDMSERALAVALKDPDMAFFARRVGRSDYIGAVIGYKPEIGGQWVTTSYDVNDGQILKIFAAKKTHWKGLETVASVFLHVREEAPYQKVKVKLLGKPQTKLKYADITGRFDVLTLEEAREHGVRVPAHYEKFFDKVVTDVLFEVELLESGLSLKEKIVKQTVHTSDGPAQVTRKEQLRVLDF